MTTLHQKPILSSLLFSILIILITFSIPSEAGRTVLTVQGVSGQPINFSMADLEAMPTYEVTTETIWTDNSHTYSAVAFETLLKQVSAPESARTVTMVALNDYSVEVAIETLIQHNAFIAFAMDGKKMRIRDKGPLWVLYPFSDQPDINIPPFQAHSIWQLKTIIIR